jgi:hypothetical protein
MGLLDIRLAARNARRTEALAIFLADDKAAIDAIRSHVVRTVEGLRIVDKTRLAKLIRAADRDITAGTPVAGLSKFIDLSMALSDLAVIYDRIPVDAQNDNPMLLQPQWRIGFPIDW